MRSKYLLLLPLLLISFTFISAIDISTCQELQDINTNLAGDYVQTQNIDCSDTINWNDGAGFVPLGVYKSTTFTGNYDGQGYTISNLYINRTTNHIGVFYITASGNVSNVNLINVNIYGAGNVGGLSPTMSSNSAKIENCFVSGNIEGNSTNVGGLVGQSTGTILNSRAEVNVGGTGSYVGGLVGTNAGGIIRNCYATGDVTGTSNVGGFMGSNSGMNDETEKGTVWNCYATGDVIGDNVVGGFVGLLDKTIMNVYSTGSVTGNTNVGGLVGYLQPYPHIINSYWDTETSGTETSAGGTGLPTSEMKDIETFSDDWDFDTIWYMDNSYPLLQVFYVEPQGFIQTILGVGNTLEKDTLIQEQTQLPSGEQPPVTKISLFQGISNWFQNIWAWIKGLFN